MTSQVRIPARTWGAMTAVAATLCFGFYGCGSDDNGSSGSVAAGGMAVSRSNLVADEAGQATITDSNLKNAWGLARSPSGPFWVADNHTGVSTLYDDTGTLVPLVVTIPPPAGSAAGTTSSPTGMVFNGGTDFVISSGANSGPSLFIFSTEDGTISAWSLTVNPNAILEVDNSSNGSIYKGLALASNGSANFLYATDFHNGRIDAFDANFTAVQMSFMDPNLPSGYAPFGISAVNGKLYVTYAKQDEDAGDDVHGPGNGYVDVFETNGTFDKRFASQGVLNSPWAVVLTPTTFGSLGNTLLIGNFGDGRINAFDVSTGASRGALTDGHSPIAIDGLWALEFGGGNSTNGSANTLFFTAGPGDESHGLFGSLQPM